MFHTHKKPSKIQNWAYTYRIEPTSSVLDQECPQMPAYVSVRTAYSEYDYRNNVKYITQSSICYRYARHTLEVWYSYASCTVHLHANI